MTLYHRHRAVPALPPECVAGGIRANLGRTKPGGTVRPMFPDAFSKCETCGATMKVAQDVLLHTSGTGVCIIRHRENANERSALLAL